MREAALGLAAVTLPVVVENGKHDIGGDQQKNQYDHKLEPHGGEEVFDAAHEFQPAAALQGFTGNQIDSGDGNVGQL